MIILNSDGRDGGVSRGDHKRKQQQIEENDDSNQSRTPILRRCVER